MYPRGAYGMSPDFQYLPFPENVDHICVLDSR